MCLHLYPAITSDHQSLSNINPGNSENFHNWIMSLISHFCMYRGEWMVWSGYCGAITEYWIPISYHHISHWKISFVQTKDETCGKIFLGHEDCNTSLHCHCNFLFWSFFVPKKRVVLFCKDRKGKQAFVFQNVKLPF